jgi:hypothetical protein
LALPETHSEPIGDKGIVTTEVQGIIFIKIELFIMTAERTSNSRYVLI